MSSTTQLQDAVRQLSASLDQLAAEAMHAQRELQILVDTLERAKRRLQTVPPHDPAAERFLAQIYRQMKSIGFIGPAGK